MTEENFEKYKTLREEVRTIKNFLAYTQSAYRNNGLSLRNILIKPLQSLKEFNLMLEHRDYDSYPKEIIIPKEMQAAIVELLEEYIIQKEYEMQNL